MLQIDPRWLTSTVCGLLDNVIANAVYESLPVLADALEDCGCDDHDLLARLRVGDNWAEQFKWFKSRGGWKPEKVLEWLARWSRPECAAAIAEVERIAKAIGGSSGGYKRYRDNYEYPLMEMSFSMLMCGADEWNRTYDFNSSWPSGEYLTQMGSENWCAEFPEHAEAFWKAWQTLTGDVPAAPESFFSCSC